jgi:hypothetical protein
MTERRWTRCLAVVAMACRRTGETGDKSCDARCKRTARVWHDEDEVGVSLKTQDGQLDAACMRSGDARRSTHRRVALDDAEKAARLGSRRLARADTPLRVRGPPRTARRIRTPETAEDAWHSCTCARALGAARRWRFAQFLFYLPVFEIA